MSEKIKAKMVDSWWLNDIVSNPDLIVYDAISPVNNFFLLTPEHNGKTIFSRENVQWQITADSEHDGWPEGAKIYMRVWGYSDGFRIVPVGTFVERNGVLLSPYEFTGVYGVFGYAVAERVAADEWVVTALENAQLIDYD
jgi:hypothetical protein